MNRYLELFNKLRAEYGIEDSDAQANELSDFLEAQNDSSKPEITEAGLKILEYLQGSGKTTQKAKDIAEGMGVSSKKVSGSIRKLVSDGFVDKFGSSPVTYSLTEKGKTFDIENYKKENNEGEKE